MAKLKSAYRPKPQAEIIPQPDGPANIEPQHEPEIKPETTIQAEPRSDAPALEQKTEIKPEPEESEATKRLKRQLADLEYSAQLSRQAAQMVQHVPLTRDQKLEAWRQAGMPDDQAAFLKSNPEMIDYSDLTAFAANEAVQAGHERGSEAHMRATKDLFDRHMEHLKQQAAANGADRQSTPEFFRPEPSLVPPRAVRNNAAIVSAPVSRAGGPSGEYGPNVPMDPRKVHLTAEEREMAKVSGISEAEYARQKVRMMIAKQNGEIV